MFVRYIKIFITAVTSRNVSTQRVEQNNDFYRNIAWTEYPKYVQTKIYKDRYVERTPRFVQIDLWEALTKTRALAKNNGLQ